MSFAIVKTLPEMFDSAYRFMRIYIDSDNRPSAEASGGKYSNEWLKYVNPL